MKEVMVKFLIVVNSLNFLQIGMFSKIHVAELEIYAANMKRGIGTASGFIFFFLLLER
jgi:hypothetical protein